ncbi:MULTISPECIES: NAD(P)/FAD-dependent oxidoreductase [unclassified Tenacibaculum]|uniref:NAD(P)/FAD-dependent oxidoreductase n=1 Tax=unclassified Tenacibaculum TaxID=2635139 RepID=UPI001F466347|nr:MULTISPECIES: NAD(P)/FAD-dependent oxidoreductase [unclassified Tenacibaculum]MCF2873105.1 NAD(P)/FAD-dependent oxidoreductase [Tenacibaculum sp. Cn5-1]MCF2933261.1 NAD(P)/FAD-dependent oxidoreductase [Tenacibaculum sp. Cn5-34]MCG7510158.1 NAD(P)/FAD-dependent oxidoreductase [Tenacibaculum sp. Cn5-46]
MKKNQKIVVIGGGPAGAVIAMQLAKYNMEIIVLEANAVPIQKPGECLPPNINPLLKKLELDHLLSKHKNSYSNQSAWGTDELIDDDFISGVHGNGTHINRKLFETDLANEAQKVGVIWHTKHILRKCKKIDTKWHLEIDYLNDKKIIIADFIVDASGRKSIIGRCLNLKRKTLDKLVGISAILKGNSVLNASTLVETCANGWWYTASLPSNELIVSFMTDSNLVLKLKANKHEGFNSLLQKTNHVKKRITECIGKDRNINVSLNTHAANSSRLEKITGENWLAVGDAACTYDPLSSYGITAAIGTAYYGSRAIIDYLQGKKEAFLTYEYLMDKMYNTYLPMITFSYSQEKRWTDNDFWRRRH